MSQPYIGEIRMVGFNFAPNGWATCDGTTMSISQNSTLFNLIGTTYGGDGISTYNLPDLRGRVPLHNGTSPAGAPYVIGQVGGTETVTVITSQIPQHNHQLQASGTPGSSNNPTGNVLAGSPVPVYIAPTTVVATSSVTTADPANGGQPHENMQPFLCINFILSLFGVYPSIG